MIGRLRLASPWTVEDYAAYLAHFEAFLLAEGISSTRFGYFATGNGAFMTALRKGGNRARPETLYRAAKWIEDFNANKGDKKINGKVNTGA